MFIVVIPMKYYYLANTFLFHSTHMAYCQSLRDLYTHLIPIQRVQIGQHPNRPNVQVHILNMMEKICLLIFFSAHYSISSFF